MTSDDYILAKLVESAWKHAGHISTPAVLAVMFAFRTRVSQDESGEWLRNIVSVPVPDVEIDPRDPGFQAALELVDSVYSGARVDNLSGGGIYWMEAGKGSWFNLQGTSQTAIVGTLMFFKAENDGENGRRSLQEL